MMDCDTTGIEPDLALIKLKKLVAGGTMEIVNQTVPRALERLGYHSEAREAILSYLSQTHSIMGAPALEPRHYPVFACSMGDNTIHYMGHVKMMAAVQPFLSGAISKTVNMPEDVTVSDVEELLIEGWRMGLKAIAIYRDNCKVAQPLSAKKIADATEAKPVRKALPRRRPSQTFKFRLGDCEGFLTAGEYPDDGLGEIFVKVAKQGSTLAGIMDAFSISISHGLQYGVPLESYVKAFTNMRFEPAGITDDPDVRFASSIVDYIFRRLAIEYLSPDKREELGIFTVDERQEALPLPEIEEIPIQAPDIAVSYAPAEGSKMMDAPICSVCGIQMRPAGSCYACSSCGATSGCS
jgi:ribonucleoside-diphosphate reductase alpha chain